MDNIQGGKKISNAIILIVDDDLEQGHALADFLKKEGFNTFLAKDGMEGLSIFKKNSIDLALINLALPDLSGLEVLSKIKDDSQSSAVIIFTDNPTLESAIEAIYRGAYSYLVKPYETDQAMLQIRKAIEKQNADISLRESEAKFRALLESAPDSILITNEEQEILMVNKQFERMFGYDRIEVVGKPVEMLVPSRFIHHQSYKNEYFQNPKTRPMGHRGEFYALRKDGCEFPVEISLSPLETHEGLLVSVAVRDVTECKRYEEQLIYQFNHDSLTGLPNRNLLIDRVNLALHHANRHQNKMAVLFVDLDHFKFINDSLGHDVGDRLLEITAERLTSCVRSDDTVVRQGGDDFVVVLPDLSESEDASKVAGKILTAVNQPMTINGHDLKVSCSIGISIYPKDGEDVKTLLKNGDAAMFLAKEHGRNTFQFFTDDLNKKVMERMTLEGHLRRALENCEFSLHYQPQMDLDTGRMIGMEALLRWHNPELGMISPARFIPLAEETGLIIPIGEWILKTACMQNKKWQNAGFPHITMAVNLSPRQFWSPDLIEFIAQVLNDSGLEPCHLELEITEGMVMRDVNSAITMMTNLKKLGIQLSIDDFGTGYSSLSHLKRFPFDKLKMDISFVREVTFDPGCAAIARTIIAMGHNLDLRVIAEGIETEGQLNYLRTHGCDEMQGFLFSRPLTSQDFELLLLEGRNLSLLKEGSPHPERTLLLVDDEPKLTKVIERVLHEDGYRILSVTNASQGFELLATNRVGVVLSDHRMPGMTGIEFLRRVKSLYPDTVRIAMSGFADLDMVTSAINQGAIYKFLTKPFDIELLRTCIAQSFVAYELRVAGKNLL